MDDVDKTLESLFRKGDVVFQIDKNKEIAGVPVIYSKNGKHLLSAIIYPLK